MAQGAHLRCRRQARPDRRAAAIHRALRHRRAAAVHRVRRREVATADPRRVTPDRSAPGGPCRGRAEAARNREAREAAMHPQVEACPQREGAAQGPEEPRLARRPADGTWSAPPDWGAVDRSADFRGRGRRSLRGSPPGATSRVPGGHCRTLPSGAQAPPDAMYRNCCSAPRAGHGSPQGPAGWGSRYGAVRSPRPPWGTRPSMAREPAAPGSAEEPAGPGEARGERSAWAAVRATTVGPLPDARPRACDRPSPARREGALVWPARRARTNP
jgi:hypothetical protein